MRQPWKIALSLRHTEKTLPVCSHVFMCSLAVGRNAVSCAHSSANKLVHWLDACSNFRAIMTPSWMAWARQTVPVPFEQERIPMRLANTSRIRSCCCREIFTISAVEQYAAFVAMECKAVLGAVWHLPWICHFRVLSVPCYEFNDCFGYFRSYLKSCKASLAHFRVYETPPSKSQNHIAWFSGTAEQTC